MARPGEESVRHETGKQMVWPTIVHGGMVDLCAHHQQLAQGYASAENRLLGDLGLPATEHHALDPHYGTCDECARFAQHGELMNQLDLQMPPGYKRQQSDRTPRKNRWPNQNTTKPLTPLRQSENAVQASWEDDEDEYYAPEAGTPANWDAEYEYMGPDIHRGFPARLTKAMHAIVHDPSRPVAERAHALVDALGHGYLGMHWTDDKGQAKEWAHGRDWTETQDVAHPDDRSGRADEDTHVVLHAHKPAREHIETDPDRLAEEEVYPYGEDGENEVPMKAGAPVHIKGVSWRPASGGQWMSHDFEAPMTHHAARDDEGLQPLPERLYHVTTARDAVLEHGLKTRSELGQQHGHGLGGGRDDTISLTTHRPTAEHLLHSLHEYHDVLNGKIKLSELKDKARQGVGAKTPYDYMLADHSDEELANADAGHKVEVRMKDRSEVPEDWEPLDEGMHGTGPQGEYHMHMEWKRPLSHRELVHKRSDIYKKFAWGRQAEGGHLDPLFIQNDPAEFAKKDPSQFALLHVRPRLESRGIKMNDRTEGTDAGEWRALSGKDLDVVYHEGREDITPRHALRAIRSSNRQQADDSVKPPLGQTSSNDYADERITRTAKWGDTTHLTWDAIGERHPQLYGDPEVHGEEADGADGEGIGWAAKHLAYSTPDDPDAENHGPWDMDFHEEHVHPKHIDYFRHGSGDHRVNHAYEGYTSGRPSKVPPLVLVHRHGVYQVADGHHRAEAAARAGKKVRAYVAYSPYPDVPSGEGDRAPYHGAEPHPGRNPEKQATRKTAVLHNPVDDEHPHEWFHGSPHEFDEFADPMSTSPLSYEPDPEDTTPWNTVLGTHFTADHEVAHQFSSGEHHSGGDEDPDPSGPQEPLRHVIHAKLHLKNPKHYESEFDMDHAAYEHARSMGDHIDNYLSGDPDEDEMDYPAAHRYAGDSKVHYSRNDPDPGIHQLAHSRPVAGGWLSAHPNKLDIAANFKKHLQSQGYDGITYGNEFEKSAKYGRGAPSAIAFEPHQIEITQHHYGKSNRCLTPEEARRQPTPGQQMIPGTERYQRRFASRTAGRLSRLATPLPNECWTDYFSRVFRHGKTVFSAKTAAINPEKRGQWYTDPETGHDMMPVEEFSNLFSADHGGRVKDTMRHFQQRWEKDKSSHEAEDYHLGPRNYVEHLKEHADEWADDPLEINGNELADGHHRGVALMELGHTHVPVKTWEPDPSDEDYWDDEDDEEHHEASRRTAAYYHGTSKLFEPGDIIDPSYELGGRRGKSYAFVTTDPQVAHNYAGHKADARRMFDDDAAPHAYEVEPLGHVEKDDTVDDRFAAFRSRHPFRVVREIFPGKEAKTAAKGFIPPKHWVYWHGSPSGDLRGGAYGLHVGTYESARQALNARIGHPVEGEWDGTREYGKTLLAGGRRLAERGGYASGYSVGQGEDHYPTGKATYGDGTPIPMDAKPNIFPVRIVGEMSNHPAQPHEDFKANGYMKGQIARGTAKRGYFYTNVAEDEGSVSAVVPNGKHLERLPQHEIELGAMHYHREAMLSDPGLDALFAAWEQSELFHAEPTGKPHSPRDEWHHKMIDKYGPTHHDDDDEEEEPEYCEDCGDEHTPSEGHRECAGCGERHEFADDLNNHESAMTDWDEEYDGIGDEVHRGMSIKLPLHVHDVVHDESRPMRERAGTLANHLNRDYLGMHWTDNLNAAKHASAVGHLSGHTEVILHAHKPEKDWIETNIDRLTDGEVFGRNHHEEAEIPMQEGAPMRIKGISWRPPEDTNFRTPPKDWKRHDFTKPIHMTASWDDDDDEDEDEPDECEHCGHDKNDEYGHGEAHDEWLHDQKWHTDWNEDRPVGAHNNNEIQRGMAISLPKHIHDIVHDEDRPLHERGKALAEHVIKSANDHGHIGRFWTDEDPVSRSYALNSRVRIGSKDDNNTPATPVVVHAKFPGYHHIETDPDELEHHGVYSYHLEDNREVPLQHGTPLEVKGVSWTHHKYGDDGTRRWDADNAEWKRHDFKEPIKAMSTRKVAVPQGIRFHFQHADHNGEGLHTIRATMPTQAGRSQVGSMTWYPHNGMVAMISTEPEYQRQGIANAMWDRAHEIAAERGITPPVHSDVKSPKGMGWSHAEEERGVNPPMRGQQPLFERPADNETIVETAPGPGHSDLVEHLGHDHGLGVDWVRRAQDHGSDLNQIHKARHDLNIDEFHVHSKRTAMRITAHDSGDSQRIFHCPFCGAGQVIGRSDGTVECEFCHTAFTVQVQPQFNSFPQTINGMPVEIPGMPGQIDNAPGAPGTPPGLPGAPAGPPGADDSGNPFAGGDGDEGGPDDDSDDSTDDSGDSTDGGDDKKPDFLKSKNSLTFTSAFGDKLNEAQYIRHLSWMLANAGERL